MLRTTCAFTMARGSNASNVLPLEAAVTANIRILPGETAEGVIARIGRVVNNPAIRLTNQLSFDPCPCSKTHGPAWERLKEAVAGAWPDAIVSPYLMMAGSDSRRYAHISECVYRFSAIELSNEERASIHANDERIPLEKIPKAVEFFLRVIREC